MTYSSGVSVGMSAPATGADRRDIQRLLDGFTARTAGVTHAVIVSLDGLQLAHAGRVGVDLADQLAACTAGLLSLAGQCGRLLGAGAADHVTVRFGAGHLICLRIGDTAGLLVVTEPDADPTVVAHAMNQFTGGLSHEPATPRHRL